MKIKISLFSQSLFSLSLTEAIKTTADIGFPAIELACMKPHFDIDMSPDRVAEQIHNAGLDVSALSLFNNFTDRSQLNNQIDKAMAYIKMATLFNTKVIKMTPGPPDSATATEDNWRCLEIALRQLVPVAEEVGVCLAFETHMRQLTDTLSGAKRLLEITSSNAVGLTVDFSNMSFAGESMTDVISKLSGRMYNTHLKNGTIGKDGSWHFKSLDDGLTNYLIVLSLLRNINYNGYLTIECLSAYAMKNPYENAKNDLGILMDYLNQVKYSI
ncbi:MAG: sugar phosphate isomerase/epimerase [Candidatus Poribacteria bacterium]